MSNTYYDDAFRGQVNMNADKEDEIDLLKIFSVIKQSWIIILIFSIIFGSAGFAVTKYAMTPQYEASVKMIVNTTRYDENGTPINNTNDTNNLAKSLVDTYGVVIKSSSMLNDIINNAGLDMTAEDLEKCITVSSVDNTQVFKITAKTDDVGKSRRIVRTIIDVAPARIMEAVEAGSCKVVSDIDSSEDPVSPSIIKNTAIAVVLGIVLAIGYALIRELQNNYITSDEELVEVTGIPCIGIIPKN